MKTSDNILVKTIFYLMLYVVFSFSSKAQDYTLNLADPSTYTITCGKVTPGQWSVKNDTCELYTPYIMAEIPEVDVDFTFNVNQSGNGDEYDRGYVYHSIDGGEWVLDTLWTAGGFPAVYELSTTVTLELGHYVQFMVRLATNDKTDFWAIMDGGVQGTDGDESQHNVEVYETEPGGLPVSLISFSGFKKNNSVILKWATASESNNDFFVVEKSEDGILFSGIACVEGAGNSNEIISYSFTDEYPYNTTFYRLKQTDFNGDFEYSQIIKVSAEYNESNKISVTCSNGIINLMVNSMREGILHVNVYSLSGTIVYKTSFEAECGNSTLTMTPDITKNAVYIVSVSIDSQLPVPSKILFN